MVGAPRSRTGGGQLDLCKGLIVRQHIFPCGILLRKGEEIRSRHNALAGRTNNPEPGVEREQRNSRIGRVHDVTRTPAENCMKLVLASEREARISPVLVTGKAIAEIPAPRTLADITRQSSNIPDLRRRDRLRCFRKNSVLAANYIVPAQRVQRDQAAYIHAAIRRSHLIESLDGSQVDDDIRRGDPLFDKREQVASTAGKGCRTTLLLRLVEE
jgi:hypothetical protein